MSDPAGFTCPSCSLESRLVLLTEDWDGDPSTGFATLRALVCPETGLTGWPPHAAVLSEMGRAPRKGQVRG